MPTDAYSYRKPDRRKKWRDGNSKVSRWAYYANVPSISYHMPRPKFDTIVLDAPLHSFAYFRLVGLIAEMSPGRNFMLVHRYPHGTAFASTVATGIPICSRAEAGVD